MGDFKAVLMSGILISYAMLQKRKFYIRGVVTGVLHMMAFAQLVVAMITLTAGIMLILTSIPILFASHYWLLHDCFMHS